MITTARRRGWSWACVLVHAPLTLSQFPWRQMRTIQDFKQYVSAVSRRSWGKELFVLATDVRNPLWFPKFVLANAKIALGVIFENSVKAQQLFRVWLNVLYIWNGVSHSSKSTNDVYVKNKHILFGLSTDFKSTVIWKVKTNDLFSRKFAEFSLEWIRIFLLPRKLYLYNTNSLHIQSALLSAATCYWSIIYAFVFADFEGILLIGIQMLIKEATKRDRLRQVKHKELLFWHFALGWVQCEKTEEHANCRKKYQNIDYSLCRVSFISVHSEQIVFCYGSSSLHFYNLINVEESSYSCASSFSAHYYSISRIPWYTNNSFID